MPRNPDNNPTERIERLLLEMAEHRRWAQSVLDLLPADFVAKLPPYPNAVAFFEEEIRHRLNRSRVLAARNYSALRRARAEGEPWDTVEVIKPSLEIDKLDIDLDSLDAVTAVNELPSSPSTITDSVIDIILDFAPPAAAEAVEDLPSAAANTITDPWKEQS
jgi:hypothetical protein